MSNALVYKEVQFALAEQDHRYVQKNKEYMDQVRTIAEEIQVDELEHLSRVEYLHMTSGTALRYSQ